MALVESDSNPAVKVIDETSVHLDRNQSYANMVVEKNVRGVLRSEVDRSLNKDSIVIVDSLNNIKGYRYELWCLARVAGTRYCVVYCDFEEDYCRKWNEERRETQGPDYNDKIFDDLVRRFEKPMGFTFVGVMARFSEYKFIIQSCNKRQQHKKSVGNINTN
ncbi:hypothetical protein POM88_046486 [Heracleum sosnowskyi]|uniref:Uncharacterized protein n=1 Tax=Heracleum sosnowskyi TaxID=360622 RepID=A0AAD8M774_9APIA|nr:hypothetical protein POM88_046486 [Heracleum sosnowskyi]